MYSSQGRSTSCGALASRRRLASSPRRRGLARSSSAIGFDDVPVRRVVGCRDRGLGLGLVRPGMMSMTPVPATANAAAPGGGSRPSALGVGRGRRRSAAAVGAAVAARGAASPRRHSARLRIGGPAGVAASPEHRPPTPAARGGTRQRATPGSGEAHGPGGARVHPRTVDEVEEDLFERGTAALQRRQRDAGVRGELADARRVEAAHGEARAEHLELDARGAQRRDQGGTVGRVDDRRVLVGVGELVEARPGRRAVRSR